MFDVQARQLLPHGEHEFELKKYDDKQVVQVVDEEHAEHYDGQAVQETLPPAVVAAT